MSRWFLSFRVLCFLPSALDVLLVLNVWLLASLSVSTEPPRSSSVLPRCPSPLQTYPCLCTKTSLESPVNVYCRTGNAATLSLPLKEAYAKNDLAIERLVVQFANISHLSSPFFGALRQVSLLSVEDSQVKSVSHDAFQSLNASLRVLSLKSNLLEAIPNESLSFLNLTALDLSHNYVRALSTSFPKSLGSLSFLNVSHNNISRLDSSALSSFASSLEELDLSHNSLVKLDRNVFRGLKKVKLLDLSFNSIASFDRNDFSEMLSLMTLKLSGQQSPSGGLSKLPQSIFSRTAQLSTIDLSFNSFKEVDAYITRGVRFLRKFLASHNEISSVAKRAFSTNTRLRVIDLSHNRLASVSTEMFTSLQYLESLDLSHNLIKSIEPGSLQSIYKVDINLSHNEVSFIPRHAFIEVANISCLDLSYNNLSVIHPEAFLDSDVTQLLLSYNKFTNLTLLPIGNMTGLRVLNVSHNEITAVTRKSFGFRHNVKLYEVSVIDLSYNRIREVSGSIFEKFWALRSLNFSHNELKRLGFGSFGNLPTILHVDLSHNQLRDVGGSVSGLQSLKVLDVRHNRLKSIPTLSPALQTIELENNTIDQVSCSSFPSINSLLILSLKNNSISMLESDSFCNLFTLRSLDLSYNRLSNLEEVSPALSKLASLQSLDLSYNSIANISSSSAFGTLPTLFDINLSRNGLSYIHPYALNGLLQLLSLNLSGNALHSIDFDAWKGLVSLQVLDLSYNSLTRIENRTNSMFEDLLSLQRLSLSGNRLSFLTSKSLPFSPWVPYKVNFVDLSHNHLESISTSSGFHAVQELLLHHNHIRSVVPGIFGNMSALKVLDLSNNRIASLPLGAFSVLNASDHSTIERLNLSHNYIASIEEKELSLLPALQSLDLSSNRLYSSWPERDLSHLVGRGVDINMTDNPFPCTCESRSRIDAVRKNIQRISPSVAKSLTFNHDVNTYDDESGVNVSAMISSLQLTNHAKILWNSLTCLDDARGALFLTTLSSQDLQCQSLQSSPILEGDLLIRGSHWVRGVTPPSLQIVWIILNEKEDIGNFRVELQELQDSSTSRFESVDVPFTEREYTFRGINPRRQHRICLKTFDTRGKERPFFPHNSCIISPIRSL
jgi:Leucine-rich repeat (LRR) protein